MLFTEDSSLAVDGLRGGDDDLFDRKVLVADELQHLGGGEAVDEYVLGHLRRVAAVGGLVEDYVHVSEGRRNGCPVSDVGVKELDVEWYPGRFTLAVGLGFEVVEDAHRVALLYEQVREV